MDDERIKLRNLKSTNAYFNATLVYVIANGLGQGTTLLANSFFTRYMSKSDYGLYSNYYSYVALLVPFVGMNLYYGLTNAYMDYKDEIKRFRSSVLMLSVAGLVITAFAMFVIDKTIGLTIPVVCIILALAHAYGFFLVNFFIYSMNMENRFFAKGIMLAVPNILQAIFAGVAVILVNSYVSRALGATIGVVMCGVVATVILLKDARPSINRKYWSYVLRISLPAIIGSVSAMIMQQCDKLMITSIIDEDTTAVYALIYNIGYILYAVQQATNGAWQAWIYNKMETKKYKNIKEVQKWYMYCMLVISTGLYMIAPEIVKILSPSGYWQFEYVVPFIVGSYLMLMYSMNMAVIQYEKRTDVSSIIVTISAVINVVLNYLLIPKYGGVGAAYTSVVSYMFIFIVSGLYLKFKGDYYFSNLCYALCIVCVSLMGVIFYQLMDWPIMRYVVYLCILAVEGLYMLRKRDDVRELFGGRIFERG